MKRTAKRISELYISIVITLLSISLWSTFILFFRPIYYWSISLFHIEEISGFSKNKILENYNALIDYFSPFVTEPLSLPSLIQSPHGIQHFAEVKHIFNLLLFLIPITFLLMVIYILLTRNEHNLHYLKVASFVVILVPFLFALGFLINFDWTFTAFHKLFFRNDYWLFNASKDPIIKMLPEEFFLLCGIVIIVFQLLTSIVCRAIYRKSLNRESTSYYFQKH